MPFIKTLLASLKRLILPKRRRSRPSSKVKQTTTKIAARSLQKRTIKGKKVSKASSTKKTTSGVGKVSSHRKSQQSQDTAKVKIAGQSKALPASKEKQKKAEEKKLLIGNVTHYFPRIQVIVVKVTANPIRVGDRISVEGKSTPFVQKVNSLQIESVNVPQGRKGQLVGLKVLKEAGIGDKVYKMV
jgi:hypothetical protein